VAAVLARLVSLAALVALVGSLVLAGIVFPPDAPESVRRPLARWSRSVAAILLLASGGELVLRARTMSGGDLSTALAAVPTVLAHTHFGTIWIARAVVLGVLVLTAGRRGRLASGASLCLALAVTLSTSLTGHAADQGDLSVAVFSDWLHVSAAAAWIGGIFCLAVLVLPGWPRDRLEGLVRRFSMLAGWCLAAVVASGIYNSWTEISSLGALWTTPYGEILGAKIALVLAVAALGSANRSAVVPRLAADTSAATARLSVYVAWEAALGLLVLACTALLTQASPPRHPVAVTAIESGTTRGSDAWPRR
jgi:putative copper export protein